MAVKRFGQRHAAQKFTSGRIGSLVRQYVVTERGLVWWVLKEHRKKRKSHLSHRKGFTNILGRIFRSTIPMRREGWIRWLWHCGQLIIDKSPNAHGFTTLL